MNTQGRSFEPKDDVEACALFVEGVGGATDAALRLLFAARDVPAEHRWARLGVLQRVLELGFTAPKAAVYGATHDVDALQRDEAWLKPWEDRKKIDAVLKALAAAVAELRTSRPRLLRRETLLPPRVLAALNPKNKRKEG